MTVDGAPAGKVSSQVLPAQALALLKPPRQYVSRGGRKLAHALDVFGVDPEGWRCLDAGISTGGFTDCLLQRGAASVLGIDVGYGQVHDRVRTDDRVEVRERTNIREVLPADVGEPFALVVADLSFIALRLVLPQLVALAEPSDGRLVTLVKPQFEARRQDVGKGGVVRDAGVWTTVLQDVVAAGADVGWPVVGLTASPITGPAGNVEFLAHLRRTDTPTDPASVEAAVAEGHRVRG